MADEPQAPPGPDKAGPEQADRDPAGRWKAGASGNASGRPRGVRSRIAAAVEAVFANRTLDLAKKAVAMALDGDQAMMRACLDRLSPVRRAETVALNLPQLRTASDAVTAIAAVVEAVANGEVAPAEGAELVKLVEAFSRTLHNGELEDRVRSLEGKLGL